MKRLILIILIISLLTVNLSSCGEIEIVELNERLIIEAVGIDWSDGIYNVTIEGLDSFSAGSENSSISAPSLTKCYQFQGETIGMAMNSISVVTGQIPLFSQARILLVGLETAKEKLSEVLDFFRREYTTRTDILFAVAEKKAADTVAADFGKNISAGNVLEAAVASFEHTGRSCYTPLYMFLNSVMGETDSAYCPVIGIKDNNFSETKEVQLSGTVVFGKDGSAEILSQEETLGLMIATDKINNGDFTVKTEKGTATLEIIECKTKTKMEINGPSARFIIDSKLSCDIPEFQSRNFSGLSKDDTEKLSSQAAKEITGIIASSVQRTLYDKNFDIFHLGRAIALKDSNFLNNKLQNGAKLAEFITCEISVSVSIRRIGKIVLDEDNSQ